MVAKGKVVYDILYETDYKNRLRCCSFTQEFSQNIPLPQTSAEAVFADCSVTCERLGCKLLSPRRIIIKSTLGTQFGIEGRTALKILATDEDGETFFRKKPLSYESESVHFEEIYRFGDLLPLTQSEKSIGEIVCGDIVLQQPQITLSPGKAEIKSVASIHALCEEENGEGKYYTSTKSLPINIEYRNDSIDDNKHLTATLEPINSEFSHELDQYGESRIIKTDFSVKMKMAMSEEKELTVADDVFEKEYDGTPVVSTSAFPKLFLKTDAGFSEEAKIPPVTPAPERLLDSNVRSHKTAVEITENGVKTSGVLAVTVTYDSTEGIFCADQAVPYEHFLPIELPKTEPTAKAETYPIEVQSTLHSDGSISSRIVASTRLSIYTENEESFVSDVAKRTAIESCDDGCSLVYCFPKKKESLWDIAKQYRANPETVREHNKNAFNENGEALDSGKPILIKA